jgi:hypothetical protein
MFDLQTEKHSSDYVDPEDPLDFEVFNKICGGTDYAA